MAVRTEKLNEVSPVLIYFLGFVFFPLVDVAKIYQQFRLGGFLSEPTGEENMLKYIKHYQKSVC